MLNFLKDFFQYKSQRAIGAGRTDQGLVRQQNEDAFFIMNDRRIFLVADGMGGHNAGEVASRVAIDFLVRYFQGLPVRQLQNGTESIQHTLITGFRQANQSVIAMAAADPRLRGMGCTLIAGLIDNEALHTCHVGDTRCYLAQDTDMRQITHDHSVVADLPQGHGLEPGNEKLLRRRNVVTKAIGYIFPEDPEYHYQTILRGDRILFCSDGLWSMLDDAEMHRILMISPTPQAATDLLIERANEAGGRDNITAVVVFC